MPKVVHFEVEAKDVERSTRFYKEVFGWEIVKAEGMEYFLANTGPQEAPGIGGALMPRMHENEAPRTINWIDVPSADDYMNLITTHGGKVLMDKQQVPGVGIVVLCEDTEGVHFGIIEFEQQA